jgi:hypothetical protein
MAGNLESRTNHGFLRRTARNIGLGLGTIVLALASGCVSQKSGEKGERQYTPDYDVIKDPDSRYKKSEKIKSIKLFEVSIGLGEGNSYSFVGGKLSGLLNIDKHISLDAGIGYGFAPAIISNKLLLGKLVTNGSASFYYKFMDEQSLFLRAFCGIQGLYRVYDDCGHITALNDVYGGGILIGSRFASAEGIFIEFGLGASILHYPKEFHKKYSSKGAADFGFGFKFG